MKLNEIIELPPKGEQLDEVNFKQALAGGAFALGTMLSPSLSQNEPVQVTAAQQAEMDKASASKRAEMNKAMLTNTIMKKYRVSPSLAQKVATLAQKYEKASFPKAEDILAIAGIESSFIPTAVSNLKKDPAMGLMQVRPGVWELNTNRLATDIEYQIKSGAEILHKYYKLLGSAEDAVHAYNVGIGNFRRGNHNIKYVHKYKNERQRYRS